MRAISTKAGIVCGILATLVFLVLYLVAIASDPQYAFFKNYLSDLGVGPGAWAFNSSLVVAGLLVAVFAIFGLRRILGPSLSSRAGTTLLAICGILLLCVGVFNENYKPYHYAFSVSFFLIFVIALISLSIAFYQTRVLGRFGYIVSGTASALGLILVPMGGDPQAETVAVLAIVTWGLLIAGAALVSEYGHRIP